MPSQLVDEVRHLIRAREEAGRPVTALERTMIEAAIERTMIEAAIIPRRNTPDLVDELEAALAYARTVLLSDPPAGRLAPDSVDQLRKVAARRLIAAARAVLDHDPAREELEVDTPLPDLDPDRRLRADVDG